ncbi:aminoglycoside phosphotransferase family protein [Actinoplanes sp. NPDC089786]|uniref:phosphotransferase family protein n=1 Tax=Actinoplanes sp. NPDC089786 TaxID=3155185 RepID=UPI003414C4DE
MESLTKNRQPVATLRAMAERAYGAGLVPAGDDWVSELGHGWFNAAYRMRLRDGRQAVLKVAPPPGVEVMTYERDAMATELAALELIREHTGVPVPAVHFADRGRDLCDADWFLMDFVNADNYGMIRDTLAPAEQNGYDEAVGAVNRQLNQIRGRRFGRLDGPGAASWRAFFTQMVEDLLGDGSRRDVDLGFAYADVRAEIAEHAGCLDAVTEPRFVEWDLFPNNVMIRDGRIASVIDHERAFYGDPLIEAIFIGTGLPAFGDPAAYLRGYGRTELTADEHRRRRLYNVHLGLILVIETAYRGFGSDHADWARARLAEAMTAGAIKG